MLKGYVCHTDGDEQWQDLVFAHNANEAKLIALKTGDACAEQQDCFYDAGGNPLWHIKARRKPVIDQFAEGEKAYALHFYRDENIKIFRAAGFNELEHPTCDTCGLSDYGKPEYAVCEDCYTCVECGGCQCEEELGVE